MEFIALALGSKVESFANVIKTIDDMVGLLGREQQDDNDKKEYCEVQIDVTEDTIKELEYTISNLGKAIDEMNTGIATLTDEIAALVAGVEALDKSVAEATETRKRELSEDERITLNMGGTLAPTNPPGGISGTGVT